ncbi:hypothetical protein KRM28CT15_10620 [Krasilnikovia sp. M28-CT-15]
MLAVPLVGALAEATLATPSTIADAMPRVAALRLMKITDRECARPGAVRFAGGSREVAAGLEIEWYGVLHLDANSSARRCEPAFGKCAATANQAGLGSKLSLPTRSPPRRALSVTIG